MEVKEVGMMDGMHLHVVTACLWMFMAGIADTVQSQTPDSNPGLDAKVKRFLDDHAEQWHDLNVPEIDGRTLYARILKNNYRKALEIGTSTGRSAIWIAWALSKTGGKLVTLEIDESRYRTALKNFKECGLSGIIDARLADAHQLVPELKGPFDFVFCDADKEWYTDYFIGISPKIAKGGCFAAHNVHSRTVHSSGTRGGAGEFLEYVRRVAEFETTVDDSGNGISFSVRKADRESPPGFP
jgi:caffeoyl-CoA O-methyltransferase